MSIHIPIGDRYVVTSDKRQFILNQVQIKGEDAKQAGESYLKPIGYYQHLDGLTRALLHRELKESDAATLAQCQQIITDTAAACLAAFSAKKP